MFLNKETQTETTEIVNDELAELVAQLEGLSTRLGKGPGNFPHKSAKKGNLSSLRSAVNLLTLRISEEMGVKVDKPGNSFSSQDESSLMDIERLRNIRKQCRNLFVPAQAKIPLTPLLRKAENTPSKNDFGFTPSSPVPATPLIHSSPFGSENLFSPRVPESPWLDRLERSHPRSISLAPERHISDRRSESPVAARNIVSWLRKVSEPGNRSSEAMRR